MAKRIFDLEFSGTATIELDDAVIDAVDDEWRQSLCDLHTPEAIARHVGYNLVVNELRLSSMDGWADQDDGNARVLRRPEWEIDANER